jgi:biotin carboxyl carrier protein
VVAPADGTVREVRVDEGQQVEAGSILVVLEESAAASEGGQDE